MHNIYQAHLCAHGDFKNLHVFLEHFDTGEEISNGVNRYAYREVISKIEIPHYERGRGYGYSIFDDRRYDYPGEYEPITASKRILAVFDEYLDRYTKEEMAEFIENAKSSAREYNEQLAIKKEEEKQADEELQKRLEKKLSQL